MSLILSTKNNFIYAGSTTHTHTANGVPLVYASNGDANGVFYYIGSSFGGGAWVNPIDSLKVATQVSNTVGVGTVNSWTDRASSQFYLNPQANNWIAVDLGANVKLAVTKYTIRARAESSHNLKTWRLQGAESVPGSSVGDYESATWEDIDVRTDDTQLINIDAWGLYTANMGNTKAYRYFRILKDGVNHNGADYFCLGEFEMYGLVKVST